MRRFGLMSAAVALALITSPAQAQLPTTWDGLVLVPSKNVKALYLRPGADFRAYNQVMFDPPQVAFKKNWVRNYNFQQDDLENDVSNQYVIRAVAWAQKNLAQIFPASFTRDGFQVATAPGTHVLRLGVSILDVNVAAPDVSVGIESTYTIDSGSATYVIEARDSVTGQLLGRAIDAQIAGENTPTQRNRATNEDDFHDLFQNWAKISAKGLNTLRSMSPINASGVVETK